MRGHAVVLALLVLCVPLSGCLSDPAGDNPGAVDDRLRLEDRHLVEWNWTGSPVGCWRTAVHRSPVQEALIGGGHL